MLYLCDGVICDLWYAAVNEANANPTVFGKRTASCKVFRKWSVRTAKRPSGAVTFGFQETTRF